MFEVSARSTYASSGLWNEVPEAPQFLEKGACKGKPKKLFYPERGDGRPMEALAICSLCVVKSDCLEYAIEHEELHGVWGGMTERERKKLLRGKGVKTKVMRDDTVTGRACRRGHPINAVNTSFIGDRWYCLVCRRARAAERRSKLKESTGE